jgi:DNA-binding winged helix-turn-helix (wHTH) protein/TolB-like protein/Flp pilus assembly protein TadD
MNAANESSPESGSTTLQVGDWTVECELNELSTTRETVRLEPKAMAALVYLADRPGQVVSRTALLSAVWPNVFVGDDSLTQVVIKLRKALGDVPGKPEYIQTISKRGYRLIAPVRRLNESALAQTPAEVESVLRRRKWRLRWIAGAGLATMLLAAGSMWWIRGRPAIDAPFGQMGTAGAIVARVQAPAVAISPFEALSSDPQEALLARGITADLVTDLSKVFGIWVIGTTPTNGRPSSELRPQDPLIRYLVSGSVQRVDERLHLYVHLSDAATGKLLWSERFDRDVNGPFAVQEELSSKILKVLPSRVSKAELQRLARRHTESLEAYELFQKGNQSLLTRQRGENENARESFRRAIALDADFARAYAGLALTYAADYRNRWAGDGAAALRRAFELAETANQIDPDIPETYWVLAFVYMERREHDLALRLLQTAIGLNPSFADAYALIGSVQTYLGRPADTVASLRIAMHLDPQASHLHFLNLGRAYLFLGDLEQAKVNLQQALSRNAASLEAHVYMAALHELAGETDAGTWEAEEIRSLQPMFSSRDWLKTYPMTDEVQKTKLAWALAKLGF